MKWFKSAFTLTFAGIVFASGCSKRESSQQPAAAAATGAAAPQTQPKEATGETAQAPVVPARDVPREAEVRLVKALQEDDFEAIYKNDSRAQSHEKEVRANQPVFAQEKLLADSHDAAKREFRSEPLGQFAAPYVELANLLEFMPSVEFVEEKAPRTLPTCTSGSSSAHRTRVR